MGKLILDAQGRKILRALQVDATIMIADLSAMVSLSPTACWKRIRKLEANGYIQARVTLLDREKLDLGVTVFVSVRTNEHDEKWLNNFAQAVAGIPDVVEFYRMSGDVDYLLKIVCRDIEDYDRIYRELIRATKLSDVSSSVAMEQIKCTTQLPI
tara:strand:+ start:619 stop:1083 length:465 start_codon:yes stop_codon:yes gene_type:complete